MSAASRFVRLILAEYGERAELVEERPWERRPEFLALNPAATLPILTEDSGPAIVGGMVIAEYLDETRGAFQREKRLLAEKAIERAEIRRLTEWFLIKLDGEATPLSRARARLQAGNAPRGRRRLARCLGDPRRARQSEASHALCRLARRKPQLALRADASYADLAAAAAFSILDYLGEISWDKEPLAKEWYTRVKSRPSFRPFLTERIRGIPPVNHYAELDF